MDLQNLRKLRTNRSLMIFPQFFVSKFCNFSNFFANFAKIAKIADLAGALEFSNFSKFCDFSNFPQILQLRANLHTRNSAKYSSNKTSHTHSEPFFLYLQFNKTSFFPTACMNCMAHWHADCPYPSFTQRQLSNWDTLLVNKKLVLGF